MWVKWTSGIDLILPQLEKRWDAGLFPSSQTDASKFF
jgi:hypothetical protein